MIKQNSWKAWLLASRPKTLTAACMPVASASALAWSDGKFKADAMFICLLFACLMQVAANFINDLYDFLKGSDRSDRLGPERACAQGWISVNAMKTGIIIVLVSACFCGLSLLVFGRPEVLVAIGLGCVVFAFLYTTLLSYCGLGDVLVLLFFGLVPVMGTYYVQAGTVTSETVLVAVVCGVVTDTLLILNNYRDRDTDRRDGKRTLVAILGERFGRYAYLMAGIIGCGLCLLLLLDGRVWAALLPAAYLPFHIITWKSMSRIRQGKALNRILGETSRNMLLFALLLSVGLILG